LSSDEGLEGARDLIAFEIGYRAIGSLSSGITAQENPLAKALATISASILMPGSASSMKRKNATRKTNAGCMIQCRALGLFLNESVSIPGSRS
jgi:hypothetical protein